jgi:hypothetical protein
MGTELVSVRRTVDVARELGLVGEADAREICGLLDPLHAHRSAVVHGMQMRNHVHRSGGHG